MPVVKIIASFLLRGIDYQTILAKYKNGDFSKIKLEVKAPINPSPASSPRSNNPFDKNFSFKDKSGNIRTFVFANQCPAKKCYYCLKDMDKDPAPLPIKRMNSNDLGSIVDRYCDLRCVYAGLKRIINVPYEYRDNFYEESEMLLKQLFAEQYPNIDISEFKPAADRSLLKEFGGDLEYDEWKSTTYNYVKNNSTLIVPLKCYYEKVQCSS